MSWKARPKDVADAVAMEIERRRRRGGGDAATVAEKYARDPVGFCRAILKVAPTTRQAEVLEALIESPHRVMVRSANNVGKTALSAIAALWFYSTRDPSVVILTAPTYRQVCKVTFKEVRRLYRGGGVKPKSPHIETSPFHILTGFTAIDESSFQGLRERSNMIVFEECTGIAPEIWAGAKGILSGGDDAYFLAIFNPTDSSSQTYIEEMSGAWRVFSLSAFEHPNIYAEIVGEPPPIPAAVRLSNLLLNMNAWGEFSDSPGNDGVDLLDASTYRLDAITDRMSAGVVDVFPGRYWAPTTPEGDARILGRYPSQSAYSVFSDHMFDIACRLNGEVGWTNTDAPVIGCDVSRFGDDATAIHVRRGRKSIHHESFRNRDTAHIAGRLKELCRQLAGQHGFDRRQIAVLIDDTGVGGGVTDQRDDFKFIGVNASSKAIDDERYDKIRSELLFDLAERMSDGRVSLAGIPERIRHDMRIQATGITYKLDNKGRRVAEPKDKMKARLGRSPDDLDAFALAYYRGAPFSGPGEGAPVPFAAMTSPFGMASGAPVVQYEDRWHRR